MTTRMRNGLIVAGLFALALGVRLFGIGWGLPAVYEEAYPFKKSWEMWGWGPSRSLDMNPHFFNYPSFYFYVQFIGQGLLFLVLKLRGAIDSALDYRVLYALDKTSFYLMGRTISALFGAATVPVMFLIGRRIGGLAVAIPAALLVALDQVHISKSRFIEVDVPMTLLTAACCYFALRILDHPKRRDYLLAGLFAGLATSTKYNGALLALPIFVAHLLALARQPAAGTPRPNASGNFDAHNWTNLALAAAVAAASFILTSPYVLLDRAAFWTGFNYERQHMRVGHFGLDDSPAILFYLQVFARSLLGWPMAILAAAGLVWALVRKQRWAFVLAVFPIVYLTLISGFAMKAERYVLPLMPIAAIFATWFVAQLAPRLRPRAAWLPAATIALATAVMLLPLVIGARREAARMQRDTRTESRNWIEANVPPGSFLVIEPYGPEPLGALDIANLDADVRERITKSNLETPIYAVFQMPMYQVRPENTAIFYFLSLYDEIADIIVTSSSVVSRYRKNPSLFAAQVAFYDSLETRWTKRIEFDPSGGSGSRLVIYSNPRQLPAFSKRATVPPPPPPPLAVDLLPGSFSGWFERFGYLYETYGFNDAAVPIYIAGLRYPDQPVESRRNLGVGAIRTSIAARKSAQALSILDQLEKLSPQPQEAAYWRALRAQLVAPQQSGGDTTRAR